METLSAQSVEEMPLMMFSLQALLMRHETYIADSEQEREAMTAHIETLEVDKQTLERKNASAIEENRSLLDQLEAVNNAVMESDTHVTSLQATLQSTQLELQKLSRLAARTERLEQQLAEFEREQASWQESLEAKEGFEKAAVGRWQKAERTLADLEGQIERIEREAKEEKERHVEVVGRMERRHAVEAELNTAAGRLKGAAASKLSGKDPGGTSVVSHFVKDILQDNANLQLGIVELREMLQNSNDEVEGLRNQLFEHQPAADEDEADQATGKRTDLRAELTRATSQELHVHHHYHPPSSGNKAPTIRRPKKKRYGVLTPGHFTPPSGFSTPRSSISYGTPSSAATILQQTAVSIPKNVPSRSKRFSTQSNQTYQSMLSSSGPSSPHSTTNRTSSIFDRVFSDAGHESSRPTTPDTDEPGSPPFAPVTTKRPTSGGFRTHSAPMVHRRGISPGAGRNSMDSMLGTSLDQALAATSPDVIPEESEAEWQDDGSAAAEADSSVDSPFSDELLDPMHDHDFYKPSMRRAASHESLLSVSGMDIHTLRARPSQLLAVNTGRSFTSQAVISGATAHAARPAAMSRPLASSRNLLSGVAAEQRLASRPSLGSKVGGWVFGRWGATPAPTAASQARSVRSSGSNNKPPSRSSASDKPGDYVDPQATPKKPKVRPPGINQCGPIFGFPPEMKTQHLLPPVMMSLDEEALKGALGDDAAH
ncbi:hypothetical protein LTR36_006138 [Oleoguttula mirabilis]|uniref:Uncharacterized protein n=1 Tax=Oleoguttula mirabilis TaxID=1507867 RepID=A0AAV9JCR2_9PEZI|nr:hypothetical protein LTR36_006138 [Oleoguttula mirabilis]